MIQRARPVHLLLPPVDKRIRRNVHKPLPVRILDELRYPGLEETRTTTTPASTVTHYQIRFLIVQMLQQRLLGSVPDQFRFEDARSFSFPFLDEFLGVLGGNLKIRHAIS